MSTESGDIFRSAADYYTEFRKPYPPEVFDRIRDQFHLDGRGSLLDVGCGTGQIILPMSRYFDRAVGVDVSEEMIAVAQQSARDQPDNNAEFRVMRGEDIAPLGGEFRLITFGSALHWMDIPLTLSASYSLAGPGGGVAILGMRSIWGGDSDWERAVIRVVQRWMGQGRRAGKGTFDTSTQADIRFEDALNDAGFDLFDVGVVEARYTVDVEFILGHLYTTSYCNRDLLGDRVGEFEEDMALELQRLRVDGASGTFVWSPGVSYIFARKRV